MFNSSINLFILNHTHMNPSITKSNQMELVRYPEITPTITTHNTQQVTKQIQSNNRSPYIRAVYDLHEHNDIKEYLSKINGSLSENEFRLASFLRIYKDNPVVIKALVHEFPDLLKDVKEEFKNDFYVVMAAVTKRGYSLRFASETLKDNHQIVTAAVQSQGTALKFASDTIKNNYFIVKDAVQNQATALEFASESLKNNFDIVMAAVSKRGYALRFASDSLKDNLSIVRTAYYRYDRLHTAYEILSFASPFIQLLYNINALNIDNINHLLTQTSKTDILRLIPLLKNKTQIENIVKQHSNDFDIALEGIKKNHKCLLYVSENLKHNQTLTTEALHQSNQPLPSQTYGINH